VHLPRMTTRRWMIAIAMIAVALGGGIEALRQRRAFALAMADRHKSLYYDALYQPRVIKDFGPIAKFANDHLELAIMAGGPEDISPEAAKRIEGFIATSLPEDDELQEFADSRASQARSAYRRDAADHLETEITLSLDRLIVVKSTRNGSLCVSARMTESSSAAL
jgi:hypothetical protein